MTKNQKREQAARDRLLAEIRQLRSDVASLAGEKDYMDQARIAHADVQRLREEVETLKIEKLRLVEEQDTRWREVEHKVGLERMRQEFEAEQKMSEIEVAKREALVEVREENLAAEREAFEKQLRFITERMTAETDTLQKLMGQILERLPDVTATYDHGDRPKAAGEE